MAKANWLGKEFTQREISRKERRLRLTPQKTTFPKSKRERLAEESAKAYGDFIEAKRRGDPNVEQLEQDSKRLTDERQAAEREFAALAQEIILATPDKEEVDRARLELDELWAKRAAAYGDLTEARKTGDPSVVQVVQLEQESARLIDACQEAQGNYTRLAQSYYLYGKAKEGLLASQNR